MSAWTSMTPSDFDTEADLGGLFDLEPTMVADPAGQPSLPYEPRPSAEARALARTGDVAMDLGDDLNDSDTVYDETDPRLSYVHVMQPCMRYACGGCICGCSGPKGRMVLGVGNDDNWARVTCPECRAIGREELIADARRQMTQQATIEN